MTCEGRLAFLRQTLPLMLRTRLPMTVVDFDCPDGTRGFLAANYPAVRVAAVDGQPDKAITGWGYEDVDLYRRLQARDLRQRPFPQGLMTALPHSDAMRLEFLGKSNKWGLPNDAAGQGDGGCSKGRRLLSYPRAPLQDRARVTSR